MSENPLYLSSAQLLGVYDQTKTATAIHVGETAVIQAANNAMLKIWGKGREVIGKSLEDALPELKGQPFIEMFAKVWREGLTVSGTDTAANLEVDGEVQTYYFDFEYRAIKDEEGRTICILHTAIDVTERVVNREVLERAFEKEQALQREQGLNEELAAANEELNAINEELHQSQESLDKLNTELEARVVDRVKALSESEERFRTMAEGTDVLIAVGDETSNAIYFNTAWCKLTGRSMEDLLEFGWVDLIHPEDKNDYVNIYLSAFEKREPFTGEFRVKAKNGDYRWLLAQGPPRFKPDGSFAGYISSCTDITELKSLELEVKSSNEELAAINEEMTTANEELAAINEEMAAANEELAATNEELLMAQNLLGNALEQLTKSESKLRYLLAGAPVAIALLDGRGLIVSSANNNILEIWGKSTDIIGKPIIEGIPELVGQPFLKLLDDVFTSGEAYVGKEARTLLTDREIYVNFVYQPIKNENGETESILITANEVTEQVISRQKVEAAENAMRLAIEAANFGTWHIHSKTRAFITSDRLKELFGFYPHEDISIEDALAQILEKYRGHVATTLENAIYNGGNYDISYPILGFHDQKIRWVRAIGNLKADPSGEFSDFTGVVMDISDQVVANQTIQESEERFKLMAEGSNMLVAVGDEASNATYFSRPWTTLTGRTMQELIEIGYFDLVHPDDQESFTKLYFTALEQKKSFSAEFRILNTENEYRWLLASASPRFRKDGSFEGYVSSCMDITELKKDEERKNDFIGMVSHELKTPLTSLNGYLQILQRKASKESDSFTIGALETANKQIKKMTTMINGFLNISRLESGKIVLNKSRFKLNELISATVEEAMVLDSSHHITNECASEIEIFGDYDKISNVVSNLLSNAVKYSPNNFEITVKCGIVDGKAQVSVKDQGMGIAKNDTDKLFERYYRVENNNSISGFGIGLYLSAEIVERHHGNIWVESELDQGSTFYFSLPLAN